MNHKNTPSPTAESCASTGSAPGISPVQALLPTPEPASRSAWWLLLGVALPGVMLSAILCAALTQWTLYPESPLTAVWMGAGVLAVCAALCAVWALLGDRRLPGPFWAGISGAFCIWLTFSGWTVVPNLDQYDGDLLLIACSLAMVIITATMLRVVLWLTPPGKAHSVGLPFVSLLGVPVLFYMVVALLELGSSQATTMILLVIAVAATYGFLLLLVRTLYLVLLTRNSRPMQITVVFVLPLLGLLISQTFFPYAFWDFSSPIYYLMVLANGVLLLIPEPKGALRLLLHFGRGVGMVFVLYFFICLSPFYALSLVGMVAAGAGILVLSPLFLLLYQGRATVNAFRMLVTDYGRLAPVVVFLLGMALVPAGMTLYFASDRENIQAAMAYVDGSAGGDSGRVNIPALRRSLGYMGGRTAQGRSSPPLVTGLYNRSVSGSRVMSSDAYLRARALFLDEGYGVGSTSAKTIRREGTPTVVVRDIEVETVRDGDDYRSTLHLTIEHTGTASNGEYATAFSLPDGVYISGYYLDVLGERKQGLMSVREAAVWIYERTVSRARDPGILYYDGDEIFFRVFPFAAGEVRRTGIEFLHRDRTELRIAGRTVVLAPDAQRLTEPVVEGGVAYFSAEAKRALMPASRRARYVFIVDCSERANRAMLAARVREFCAKNNIAPADATVMALNYRSEAWSMQGDWEAQLQRFPAEGGFGLDTAIGQVYGVFADAGAYPVVIAVTDSIKQVLLPGNMIHAAALCPELDGYLQLSADSLIKYPFDSGSPVRIGGLEGAQAALCAEVGNEPIYLYNNGRPQVVVTGGSSTEQTESPSAWAAAMRLEGDYRLLETAGGGQREPVQVMQESMRTGVMTPLTSYIVLETAEQEAALLARQQQLLAGGGTQAAGEPVNMSEPPLLVCLLAVSSAVIIMRRRRRVV